MPLNVRRVDSHQFVGINDRGAEVHIGRSGQEGSFSPSELLQIATAGCSALTVENLVVRRIGDDATFAVSVSADRSTTADELDAIHVDFDVDVKNLDEKQRHELAAAVDRSIDRLCTVSRTLKKGIPVTETFPTE